MSQLLQYYRSFQSNKPTPAVSAPTFEDLSIDVNLTELQRLIKYVKSMIGLQRLVHVKMISEIAASIGYSETKSKIIPLLEGISRDSEPAVKQHLVEQLTGLSKFCCTQGSDDGYQSFLLNIIPIVSRLLEDEKLEVRQSACFTLVNISTLVRPEDLGQYILKIILELSHENDKEELRMTAAELLNSLAECLGHDLCRQFVIPELVSLAEDPVFRVRKSAALNFHHICRIGGEHELFERLMPTFVRLSKDDMFRVRRACADSLCEISKFVSDDIRIGVLVEIFLRLTQDPSKAVKQSVLQQSGMFISTLPSQAINETILSHFISMANDPTGDASVDAELKHCCAYCFPGVLKALGPNRWKEVRQIYQSLVQSRNTNVKQTLSYSLHEIAKIIGNEAVIEEELVPIFEEMIQDVEAIQIGVIKHLSDFLKVLSSPCRISYLPLLHDILHSTNPFNWRLRQSLAKQLPDLALLPPIENLYDSLFPLIMTLLQDPVSCVRKDSYLGVARMIELLAAAENNNSSNNNNENNGNSSETSHHLKQVINSVNALIQGETYQMRQLWVELCQCFLKELSKDIIEKYFLSGLLLLCNDKVCNVRIAISFLFIDYIQLKNEEEKVLKDLKEENKEESKEDQEKEKKRKDKIILGNLNWQWLFSLPEIQKSLNYFASDEKDVSANIMTLKPYLPNLSFSVDDNIIQQRIKSKRYDIEVSRDNSESSLLIPPPTIPFIAPNPILRNRSRSSEGGGDNNNNESLEFREMLNIDGLPDELLEGIEESSPVPLDEETTFHEYQKEAEDDAAEERVPVPK